MVCFMAALIGMGVSSLLMFGAFPNWLAVAGVAVFALAMLTMTISTVAIPLASSHGSIHRQAAIFAMQSRAVVEACLGTLRALPTAFIHNDLCLRGATTIVESRKSLSHFFWSQEMKITVVSVVAVLVWAANARAGECDRLPEPCEPPECPVGCVYICDVPCLPNGCYDDSVDWLLICMEDCIACANAGNCGPPLSIPHCDCGDWCEISTGSCWVDGPHLIDVCQNGDGSTMYTFYASNPACLQGKGKIEWIVCESETTADYNVIGSFADDNGRFFCVDVTTNGTLTVTPTHNADPTCDLPFWISWTGEVDVSNCPWDLNGDNVVNSDDMNILLSQFGICPTDLCEDCCPGDFNGDGIVNVNDLTALLANFGPCP